jgi:hypothetical protein
VSEQANTSVLLCELWEFESRQGRQYFSGFLGASRIVLLFGGEKDHPKRPDEKVRVWRLLVEPKARQEERRAPPKREPEPKPAPKAAKGETPSDDLDDVDLSFDDSEEAAR